MTKVKVAFKRDEGLNWDKYSLAIVRQMKHWHLR